MLTLVIKLLVVQRKVAIFEAFASSAADAGVYPLRDILVPSPRLLTRCESPMIMK